MGGIPDRWPGAMDGFVLSVPKKRSGNVTGERASWCNWLVDKGKIRPVLCQFDLFASCFPSLCRLMSDENLK